MIVFVSQKIFEALQSPPLPAGSVIATLLLVLL
jgi:hypothetical protein